ncbi:MAG: GNAT family N-acetyltransferase [Desulfovibrio sp.]|jgi:GNAT superfamily N-acetyltransferase|nr:GNAT family N-acetyltransferase [Desulfovibrio sp.]
MNHVPASPDQVIAANFLASYTWFQRHNPACTVRAVGSMVCAHASGSLTDFNVALPDAERPLPDPFSESFRRNCAAVRDFFAQQRVPFSCWIPGRPEAPVAADLGFSGRLVYTGQYLELRNARFAPTAGLTVRRVASLEDLEAFADLIAIGWSMPPEAYRAFFSAQAACLLTPGAAKQFFLGLAGGRPACCMELFGQAGAKVAGIYYVTTHPDFRRQGFAAALQSQVLRLALSQGRETAVVVSEPDECRLLGRLGFVDCSPWFEYIQAPDFAGGV